MATARTKKAPASTGGETLVFAVTGTDDFIRLQAVRELIERLLGGKPDDMSLVDLDGESVDAATVLDECRMKSLLADRKVVLVRKAPAFIKRYRQVLEDYVAAPCPDGLLVLDCPKLERTFRLSKAIAAAGGRIDAEPPAMRDLPAWIVNHAKSAFGRTIEIGAARRLAELVGDSLGKVDSELGKLTVFVPGQGPLREVHVEELVGASRAETVFKIGDAIARQDAPAALTLWDLSVSLDRKAPYMAAGGLATGFRRIAEAKRLSDGGMPLKTVMDRLKMWGDPGALKRQLDRFTLRQWQDTLMALLKIDVGAKSGLGNIENAIEKLIVRLCAPSKLTGPRANQP